MGVLDDPPVLDGRYYCGGGGPGDFVICTISILSK